jgi:cellular nucleic acid-binding protein
MESLYILKLEKNKYYVGKSSDVSTRYKQHKEGIGSSWTSKYPPIRILEVKQLTGPHHENNETKDLMKKYGIDNVRGGAYCQVELSYEAKTSLQHELNSSNDSCYKCGESGHFARYCRVKSWECEICSDTFSDYNTAIGHEKTCKVTKRGVCYRCGRDGHYSPECYARTHVDGFRLT